MGTLLLGLFLLVLGAFLDEAPDWDVGVSLVMGLSTYLLSPASFRIFKKRFWTWIPLSFVFAWFCVDGVYFVYWTVVDDFALVMRSAQWSTSLCLYLLCGLVWSMDAPLSDLISFKN